jgi:hypothetical protein
MNLNKRLEDQDFTEDEKRLTIDWLERIADGRLVVRFPKEAFGVTLGESCDKAKVRELCDKVRIKEPTIIVVPENGGIIRKL